MTGIYLIAGIGLLIAIYNIFFGNDDTGCIY